MITRVRPTPTTLIIERSSTKEINAARAHVLRRPTYMEPRRKMLATPSFCFGDIFNFMRGGNGRAKTMKSSMRLDTAPAR